MKLDLRARSETNGDRVGVGHLRAVRHGIAAAAWVLVTASAAVFIVHQSLAGDDAGAEGQRPLGARPSGELTSRSDAACSSEIVFRGSTYLVQQDSVGMPGPGRELGPAVISSCEHAAWGDGGPVAVKELDVREVSGLPPELVVWADGEVWAASTKGDQPSGASPSLAATSCGLELVVDGVAYTQDGGSDANVPRGVSAGEGVLIPCDESLGVPAGTPVTVSVYEVEGVALSESVYVDGYAWMAR